MSDFSGSTCASRGASSADSVFPNVEDTPEITPPPTENAYWGFFGTMARNENPAADPAAAWEIASRKIAETTGASAIGVRDFLDSRDGRHFADCVEGGLCRHISLEAAIDAAIAAYQGWRIGRKLSRETGIPQGLPYLTGLVTHFEILAEAA